MSTTPCFERKSLEELSSIIQSRCTEITLFLAQNKLPSPSFSSDSPSPDFIPVDQAAVQQARAELVEASKTLADLASGPVRLLANTTVTPHHDAFALQVIDDYDVTSHVPLNGSISYRSLAAACGLQEGVLRRVVRYAMISRFFTEPREGEVAHSATSRIIAEDPAARHFFGHMMKNTVPADAAGLQALRKWPGKSGPEHSGIAAAFDGQVLWEVLKNDKMRAAHFNGAMEFAGRSARLINGPDSGAFDWASLPPGSLAVDCGGGVGQMSKDLAERYDQIRFIVQDLPQVINSVAEKKVKDGRIMFEGHSFFDPQPIKDADVYVFRRIFHDWADEDAKRIIEALTPSMKPGSRLVVSDQVVPLPGSIARAEEKLSRAQDIQMMLMLGALERSLDEWLSLVSSAAGEQLRLESHMASGLCFVKA